MKNNFKDWDKERHLEVSSRGGKVKSIEKSRASKLRLRKRIENHIGGYRHDNMVQGIIEVIKFYRKDKKDWFINC